MKKRNSLQIITDAIKMMWALDKGVFIFCAINAVINAVIPYIGILLSAYVVDGLVTGNGIDALAVPVGIAVGTVFVLTVLRALIDKSNATHTENCVQKFDMLKCERTLTMDYQLLESPKVNDIRTRMRNDRNWGAGFYTMIWQLPSSLSHLMGLIIAISWKKANSTSWAKLGASRCNSVDRTHTPPMFGKNSGRRISLY